jgi:hypothetical protein
MKQQKVVRTRPKGKSYSYEANAYDHLNESLNNGYRVVMCTPIGEDLEYILEKEIDDKN